MLLQALPRKDETANVTAEVFKTDENILKVPGKETEQVRARSGTWSAETGSKQKEPAKTAQVRKEKEVRRSGDDRRQKRGE